MMTENCAYWCRGVTARTEMRRSFCQNARVEGRGCDRSATIPRREQRSHEEERKRPGISTRRPTRPADLRCWPLVFFAFPWATLPMVMQVLRVVPDDTERALSFVRACCKGQDRHELNGQKSLQSE